MKLLLVTGDPPWPATSGGRLRDELLFRAATAAGDVHLLSFPFRGTFDPNLLPPGGQSHPMPWRHSLAARFSTRLRATWHGRLVFQQHLVQHGAVKLLGEAVDSLEPDAVILASPLFDPFVTEAARGGRPVFVDMTDLRSRLVEQQMRDFRHPARWARAVMDATAVARAEASAGGSALEVWFADRADAARFEARHGARVRVVPNTVDVESYAGLRGITAPPHRFGFVGSFDYAPNVAAAERLLREVLPRLRARTPDAGLVLIGRSPPRALAALAEQSAGATLLADNPAPIRRLAEAGILAAPISAGVGTKFKHIESASACVPIVSSRLGLSGLGYRNQEEVLVAETNEEFVEAIERLWRDPALARRLTANALVMTRQRYDHRVSIAAFGEALSSVSESPMRRRRAPIGDSAGL